MNWSIMNEQEHKFELIAKENNRIDDYIVQIALFVWRE